MDDKYLITTGMTMMPQRQVKIWYGKMSDGDLGVGACLGSLEGFGTFFPSFVRRILSGKGDAVH